MQSFARFSLVAALAAGLALAVGTAAQPPAADKKSPELKAADLTVDAFKLMDIAETQKLPEAYAGAYRLFLMLDAMTKEKPMGQLDAKVEVETADGKPVAGAKVEALKNESYGELADTCRELAEGLAQDQGRKDEVGKLLASIKANPFPTDERGSIGGPKVVVRTIGGGQTHKYTINFDTLTPGAIGFQASIPIRCKMQHNNYVHFDQVVRVGNYTWQPSPATGPVRVYVITVHNHHKVPATYRLLTN